METNVNTLIHPSQPWLEAVRLAYLAPGPVPGRPYFRCFPISATLSAGQCRANRTRVSARLAQQLPYELPSWQVRPPACESCVLATAMEAGRVPFFTAAEVLAGLARASRPESVSLPHRN